MLLIIGYLFRTQIMLQFFCLIFQSSTVMTSTFKGCSAYDIVGSLNKREVRALLLDYDIERSSFRTWDSIEEMILASSDEVKNVVYQSALAKRKVEEQHRMEILKRKREEESLARNIRRRLGDFYFYYCEIVAQFTQKQSAAKKKEIFQILWWFPMPTKKGFVMKHFMTRHQMKRFY